jgi:hypothetical protein
MDEALQELVEGTGWEVGNYGDTLVCPHGNEIEMDGRCPEGCVSLLLSMGMI